MSVRDLKVVVSKAVMPRDMRVLVMQVNMSRVMRKPTFWFPTWSDTNDAVQLQKMVRGLKFEFRKKRDHTIYVAKTKALISFAVIAKLICIFVFAYAKRWFSHDGAHIEFQCKTSAQV